MKKINFLILIFILSFYTLNAQVKWTIQKPFEQKNFIKNVGQFNISGYNEKTILYAVPIDGVEYFFTTTGYVTRHKELVKRTENEMEEFKERYGLKEEADNEEKEFEYKSEDRLHELKWNGSNPQVTISALDSVSNYYTYSDLKDPSGKNTLVAHAFKKIIYENLYPHVDMILEFPRDTTGIKYSLIIKPGADISKIKLQFPLNKNLSINSNGDLQIESAFGTITDHKPRAFDKNNLQPVACTFIRSNELIGFHFDNFSPNSTIVIDPWTITPNFGISHVALDVDYDVQGNVYAYGGVHPVNELEINKYNSSGNLIWTFTPTIFYNPDAAGDFAVDIYSGNIYMVEGFNSPIGAKVIKLNSAGVQQNIFGGNPQFVEMWRIAFSKCTGQAVIAGGGNSSPTYQTCYLDSNLANLTFKQYVVTNDCCHDVNMLALDNYGNCYQVTNLSASGPLFNNQLVKLPLPNLLPISYNVPTNYNLIEAYSIMFAHNPLGNSNAYNGISTSNTNVYTSDGYALKKWAGANGSLLSYTRIHFPANGDSSQIFWGGITSDDCDNVFLGDSNMVRQYNPSQAIVNSYTMPAQVYDVKLGQLNNLYVSGNGFVSAILVSGTVGCNVLNYTSIITNATCTIPGSVSLSITGGTPPYNIIWDTNPVQTGAILNAPAGTYVFHISDSSCVTQIRTDSITIADGSIPFTATSSVVPLKCISDHNAAINITTVGGVSPFEYTWSNNQSGSSIINLSEGVYTVTITDAQGCKDTLSVIIKPSVESDTSSSNEKINIFSPNSDNYNEVFYPAVHPDSYWNAYVSGYQLTIYNRWGKKVFSSSSPFQGWDGTFSQNKKAPEGVYYWIQSFITNCENSEEKIYKGFVHLIR